MPFWVDHSTIIVAKIAVKLLPFFLFISSIFSIFTATLWGTSSLVFINTCSLTKSDNKLSNGVYAKDLVLHIINKLGVKAGVGFAYEFAGPAINELSMEERMTICNMSIEGGARCGYIKQDEKTFSYMKN